MTGKTDVLKEFSEHDTILLLVLGSDYNRLVNDVAKQLSGKKVGYVTLNKTFTALKEDFDEGGIDTSNFIFIDGITRTIKEVGETTDGCYCVSSPAALTEIGIILSKILKHGFNYIVFDSLTNLLIYKKKAPVAKFLLNTITRIKENKAKGVFYVLPVKETKDLIEESGMFVDQVIDLTT